MAIFKVNVRERSGYYNLERSINQLNYFGSRAEQKNNNNELVSLLSSSQCGNIYKSLKYEVMESQQCRLRKTHDVKQIQT